MTFVISILSSILFLVTVIPLSKNTRWWVRILDFPRFQFFVLAVSILILIVLFGEPGTLSGLLCLGLTISCLIYQFCWIFPYTKFAAKEVKSINADTDKQTLSIVTANVLMTNHQADKFLALVKNNNPDVILALETDDWWENKLDVLESTYPFTIKCPLDNLYGMHVYSRLPLYKSKIKYLVEDHIPSMHTEIELAGGQRVRAHFLHPTPPVPEYNSSSAERDAELIVIAKSIQNFKLPVIVAGDLNDVAWSITTRLFRKISGLLDPRVGRGLFNTFNAYYWPIRWPLDHLFHSDHFKLIDIKRLEKFGSDHFAFYTKLAFCTTHTSQQTGLQAEQTDNVDADEKLADHDIEAKDIPFDDS